jgi:AcrR family transcriptional regulator
MDSESEEEKSEQTTDEIFYEALKAKMKEKPLDKITVTELSDYTGINRQTFYYHFADVEDLTAKMFQHELTQAMKNTPFKGNMEEAFMSIFKYAYENKNMIFSAINSAKSGGLEYYLAKEIELILLDVVKEREKALNLQLSDDDESFIAEFYKYPFVDEALAWIKGGMRSDLLAHLHKMVLILSINLDRDILKFAEKEKKGN